MGHSVETIQFEFILGRLSKNIIELVVMSACRLNFDLVNLRLRFDQ
jgi:hypothetical protein